MKLLTLILSVYIIFLTAKPCDDAVCINSSHHVTLSAEQPVHHHDLCSPFCICQCCQAHFQVTCPPQIDFSHHIAEFDTNYILFFSTIEPSGFLIPPEIL